MILKRLIVLWFIKCASGLLNDSAKRSLFPELPNFVLVSNNEGCVKQSELYLEQLDNLTPWAYEMFDASQKSLTGFLRGNVYQLGNWDECLTANVPFKTQYCLAQVYIKGSGSRNYGSVLNKLHKNNNPSHVRRDLAYIGLCLPSNCSAEDLEATLNSYLEKQTSHLTEKNVSYSAEVSPVLCHTMDDYNNFDSTDVAFCFLVGLILFLFISGTIYDYMKTKEENGVKKLRRSTLLEQLVLSFSARENFKDLQGTSNSPLSALYGIKVVSICMIIMDHRFGTFTSGPVINFEYIENQYEEGAAFAIFHGDLFVDSFFVLSGVLVAYTLLSQFEKKIANPFFIFFVRYIRLTPVYAIVIFFYASVFENTGEGPLWKLIIGPEADDCRKNWWLNLLFLSNYINDDHMCMVHSWYLPCDFHYFIIATFLMIILKKHKKAGLSILVFLFILSVAIPAIITIVFKRPALLLFYLDFLVAPKAHPDFRLTYSKSHTRASPYIIGLFAGYMYYRLRDSNWKLSKVTSHMITFVSIVLLLGGMGSSAVFYNSERPYSVLEAGIYAGFHRIIWAVGTVGLLLSATHGHSTFLNSILSWQPMEALGKLVFSAYIVHMQYVLRAVGGTKTSKYISPIDMVPLIFGDIVVSFFTAFLLYLTVEMPCRRILKEIVTSGIPQLKGDSNVSQKFSKNSDPNEWIINKEAVESRL